MKIMILSTGEIEEHERGYAARMVEQGRAVLPPVKAAAKPPARRPRKIQTAAKDAEPEKIQDAAKDAEPEKE